MIRLSPPSAVRWIARTLEEAGFETWAVGGAVRDALAGHPSQDWDLTTRATPKEMRKLFRRTVPIGVDHGTMGILDREGTLYEVTTFRRDVETTGRHAKVAFADRIEEDLARRDFTINAVAWHPLREELFDPFGGVADMEARRLRTVGVPAERFAEDYLRILRALRFAGVFALAIEEESWTALMEAVPRMGILSPERVREELEKVLAGPTPSRSLTLYADSGALAFLYPELAALVGHPSPGRAGDEWELALRTVDRTPSRSPSLRWGALLQGVGLPGEAATREEVAHRGVIRAASLLERLRSSKARIREVGGWVARARFLPAPDADDAELRRWLAGAGRASLGGILRIRGAMARADAEAADRPAGDPRTNRRATDLPLTLDEMATLSRRLRALASAGTPLEVGDLAFDGRELIRMGYRPSPLFGEVLGYLLDRVLDDPALNEETRLAPLAVEWLKERGVEPGGRGGER